jgi:hypothetical protein
LFEVKNELLKKKFKHNKKPAIVQIMEFHAYLFLKKLKKISQSNFYINIFIGGTLHFLDV